MTDDQHRDALLAEISKHEALLTRLESDRERARERLAALRAALVALGSSAVSPTDMVDLARTESPITSAEKVRLFRSLFRGCVYRPSRSLIPAQAEHPFRARRSPGAKRREGLGYFFDFSLGVKTALTLRRDLPRSVSRWAPWTRRSQMASPTVASPMTACQLLGSSWLVTRVAVTL